MKTSLYLLLAAVIAALTAGGYYYFKEPVPKYSGTPWLMSDSTYFSPGNDDYLYYGWPINGSLLLIDYGTSTKFIKGQHQLIHPKLWANMPKLPFRITDRNAMVIYVQDQTDDKFQYFIVVNNTKLPFLDGLNQTFNYGISNDMIAHTTKAYANTIPTSEYWLPQY